jgi:hypothetical protein
MIDIKKIVAIDVHTHAEVSCQLVAGSLAFNVPVK